MKRLILSLATFVLSLSVMASSITYTADDETIFPNPERGFITMIGGHLSESNPYGVKGQESALNNHASKDKGTIVLVHYYLDKYRTTATLPDKVLNAFDEDMQVLRSKGMKAIIRFSYAEGTYEKSGGEESAKDAALDIAQGHIAQYKSHWQANADVIFCFQAGIVGAWGEWYYTDNYGNRYDRINDSRRAVIDALLEAVPQDRAIQLRTPLFKTSYMGDTKALTAEEAFTGTPRARLGQHNDAFLYDYDNMGTYTDTATQKPWLAQETLYVPIGGETDITSLSKAKKWATYEQTTAEMSRLHWTFIQSGYATQTTNWWRENGTFDELNRRMGYRYQLVSGTYSDQVEAGAKLSVNIRIKNAGYAPLYNERHAYIVLKNGSKQYALKLATDPRRWLPNGVVTTVNEQVTVPKTVPEGTYDMYLYMPDAYASLAGNTQYAIRFANTDVWDAQTGMNKLKATINVTNDDPECCDPTEAITLPATLDKDNVSSFSTDMTWYNNDYFDFGPEDGSNLERWAEWDVELAYPGKYLISEVMATAEGTGHSWKLELRQNEQTLAEYTTENSWSEGSIAYETPWDLSNTALGIYQLRVSNAMEWGRPKLKSLTIAYDGILSTEKIMEERLSDDAVRYDMLGRIVDKNYHGIVVSNGRKWLQP